MIDLLLSLIMLFGGEQVVIYEGYLSAYDQNPTDATIVYNQDRNLIPQDLSDYDGVIAVLDCSQIGQKALIIYEDTIIKSVVFDCAGELDGGREWMINGQFSAEVGWYIRQNYPHVVHQWATVIVFD